MKLSRCHTQLCGLVLSLALCGCDTKIEPGGSCPVVATPASYAIEVQPILEKYCVSCHGTASADRNGAPTDVNFDSYDSAKADGVRAAQDVLAGRMPPPPSAALDPNVACVIDSWVVNNYPR